MAIAEEKTRVAITLGNNLLSRIDDYCARTSQTRSGYIASVVGKDLESQSLAADAVRDVLREVVAATADTVAIPEDASPEELGKMLWGEDFGRRPSGL